MSHKRPKVSNSEDALHIDLEGFPPTHDDIDGISILLRELFPDEKAVDVTELATFIADHANVGTVVKSAEEEDDAESDIEIIFSVTTAIDCSVGVSDKHPVICKLRNFIIGMVREAPDGRMKTKTLEILDSSSAALFLLINERFPSLPFSVCIEALSSLPTELKDSGLSSDYAMILSQARVTDSSGERSIEYSYPELKRLSSVCTCVLEIPSTPDNDFNAYFVFILEMNKFQTMIDVLKSPV